MSLIQSGKALIFRQLLSGMFALVVLYFATENLGLATFSLYALYIPLIALATLFIDLGYSVNITTIKELPEQGEIKALFFYRIIFGVTAFVCVTSGAQLFLSVNIDFYYTIIVLLIAFFRSLRLLIEAMHQREVNWNLIVKVQIKELILYTIVAIILLIVLKSFLAVLISLLFREVFAVFLYSNFNSIKSWITIATNRISFHKLAFGAVYQTSSLLGVINTFAIVIIGGSLLLPIDIARLNWAAQIAAIGRAPFQYLPILLISYFSFDQRNGINDKKQHLFSFQVTTGVTLLISMALILIVSVVPIEFKGGGNVLMLILAIFMFENLKFVQANVLNAVSLSERKANIWLKTNVLNTLLIYFFGFLGAYYFGVVGFIAGYTIGTMSTVLYQIMLTNAGTVYVKVASFSIIASILSIFAVLKGELTIVLFILMTLLIVVTLWLLRVIKCYKKLVTDSLINELGVSQ